MATDVIKPPPKRKKPLCDLIFKKLVKSAVHPKAKFLPSGILDELITYDSVIETLSTECDLPDATEVASWVCHAKAQKLFAIAVRARLSGSDLLDGMRQLREKGMTDNNLPVTEAFWRKNGLWLLDDDSETAASSIANADDSSRDGKFIWTHTALEDFLQKQWEFLCPVFSTAVFNRNLESDCVLPFTKKLPQSSNGAFGQVTGYKIHPSHLIGPAVENEQNFVCPEYVAIKEMRDRDEDHLRQAKSWEKEARILQQMNQLNHPHIVRFHTAFRLGEPGEESHFLMLEWANGGNLWDLWKSFQRPRLTAELVKATLEQILGLAEAINTAHYPESFSNLNFRHGDLKPENILWFKDDDSSGGIGTLKIGDWGLAKLHNNFTMLRSKQTTTGGGTRAYEPPEAAKVSGASLGVPESLKQKRSRLYDIWAMGCITLEFLIWLMYGKDQLRQFRTSLSGGNSENTRFYEMKLNRDRRNEASVHRVAVLWMDHMGQDPICAPGTTALGNLLELIRTQLLVVKLPQRLGSSRDMSDDIRIPQNGSYIGVKDNRGTSDINKENYSNTFNMSGSRDGPGATSLLVRPSIVIDGADPTEPSESVDSELTLKSRGPPGWERARAYEFRDRMLHISGEDEEESYWYTGQPDPPRGPDPDDDERIAQQEYEYQTEDTIDTEAPSNNQMVPTARTELIDYGRTQLDNEWAIDIDNAFAKRVLSSTRSKGLRENGPLPSSDLCNTCEKMCKDIWEPAFHITYTLEEMEMNCKFRKCDLCRLLWETYENHNVARNMPTVTFERINSSIWMNREGPSVLSIHRSPDLETRISNEIQVGYPGLVAANSEAHFEIMRQWLTLCDNAHQGCISDQQDAPSRNLPTRVIAVGKPGDEFVQLVEPRDDDNGEWIALSHQWGTGKRFCTTTENKESYMKGMEYESLPGTFKDAVQVTRALRQAYLWIDSLCIIQGDDGDFNEESKRMEHVYSGAYCVIASSRSPGHFAGFSADRNRRDTVVLQHGETAPFYISQSIDDFNLDVLEGSLNKRGWVLQEHALARRTIYFTDKQTYFECGDGVRCETMTKMRNERAAFLGDSTFPEVIMKAKAGERVLRYQHLYKTYSRLGLSDAHDRPLAVGGLQNRILKALNVRGGYGIFDEAAKDNRGRGLLRRSLLWRRGLEVKALTRIDFPKSRPTVKVPSWSWMSVQGGIDYISPPFGGIRWEDLGSPWSLGVGGLNGGTRTDSQSGFVSLNAEARDYDLPMPGNVPGDVVFDRPGGSQQSDTKCVVLGKQKSNDPLLSESMKLHYVLVIASKAKKDGDGVPIYERVGAGSLLGKCIKSRGEKVRIY